jgi:ABC-type multidrug transport system fused ATPase/permease subunit
VLQEDFLFAGTVRENLVMEREGRRDAVARARARASRAEDVIAAPAGGLDAPSPSAARRFSTGERQLLAIARALAGGPSSSSSTRPPPASTPATEHQIEEAQQNLLAGRIARW